MTARRAPPERRVVHLGQLPLREVARAGRDMVGVQVLLGGEDERALRRRAHSGNRRSRRVSAD